MRLNIPIKKFNIRKRVAMMRLGFLAALGGQENIQAIDNCITRLRLVLADANKVDDDKLKQLGALGVVHLDAQNVQVIIGTKVTTVRNQLEMILG